MGFLKKRNNKNAADEEYENDLWDTGDQMTSDDVVDDAPVPYDDADFDSDDDAALAAEDQTFDESADDDAEQVFDSVTVSSVEQVEVESEGEVSEDADDQLGDEAAGDGAEAESDDEASDSVDVEDDIDVDADDSEADNADAGVDKDDTEADTDDAEAEGDAEADDEPAYKGRHSKAADADDADATQVMTVQQIAERSAEAAEAAQATSSNPDETQLMPAVDQDGSDGMFAAFVPGNAAEQKKRRSYKKVLAVFGIIIGVILVAYVGVSIFFMSHFAVNTVIAGIDCSFKTVQETEGLLATQIDGYQLEVQERGDQTEIITGQDVAISYDPASGQVQTLLDKQNAFAWPMAFFDKDRESKSINFAYDDALLVAAVNGLAAMNPETAIQPKDAYPEYNGAKYVVHPEDPGTLLNGERTLSAVRDKVSHGQDSVDLDAENCYVEPLVKSDNPDLLNWIDQLDRYTPYALTYTFTDGSIEVLDGATVFNWLTINEDGTYSADEDAVRAWVSDFAERHTTVGRTRTFTSVDGNTYTVSGGNYGWSVDEEAEVGMIFEMIEGRQSQTRDPIWATTAEVSNAQGDEPDWGNTYIDLNLTNQCVYFVQDGQMVFSADVVTGRPYGHETPSGVWQVLEKMRNKVLTGEMTAAGVPEYETPVSYWIRMTWGGVGFHDASWQAAFGGERYLYYGSHGCINMSLNDVAQLYDLVEEGTPIVSHY